jgi:aldehyde dehydrogenase (NAD+)
MARCQAEMGGKNVGIVLPDADLAAAAASVAGGAFRFAGQKCTATSRVVVDRRVRGAFVDALRAAAARLPVGDPAEEPTAVGPVIHRQARDRIAAAVEAAGAEILWRGDAPRGAGHWVAPLLLAGVPPGAPLAQQELFGPVLCLFEAADLDEAIALANGTEFGLSASLFTRDLDAALAYVARIDAGMVRVNADTTGVDPHAPFGGLRASGYGAREQGSAAREFYTQQRTVLIQGR